MWAKVHRKAFSEAWWIQEDACEHGGKTQQSETNVKDAGVLFCVLVLFVLNLRERRAHAYHERTQKQ